MSFPAAETHGFPAVIEHHHNYPLPLEQLWSVPRGGLPVRLEHVRIFRWSDRRLSVGSPPAWLYLEHADWEATRRVYFVGSPVFKDRLYSQQTAADLDDRSHSFWTAENTYMSYRRVWAQDLQKTVISESLVLVDFRYSGPHADWTHRYIEFERCDQHRWATNPHSGYDIELEEVFLTPPPSPR
jgi:hypothetical protein